MREILTDRWIGLLSDPSQGTGKLLQLHINYIRQIHWHVYRHTCPAWRLPSHCNICYRLCYMYDISATKMSYVSKYRSGWRPSWKQDWILYLFKFLMKFFLQYRRLVLHWNVSLPIMKKILPVSVFKSSDHTDNVEWRISKNVCILFSSTFLKVNYKFKFKDHKAMCWERDFLLISLKN